MLILAHRTRDMGHKGHGTCDTGHKGHVIRDTYYIMRPLGSRLREEYLACKTISEQFWRFTTRVYVDAE